MLRSLSREAALTDSDLRKQHIFCYSGYFQTRIELDRFIRILTDLQELSGAFIRDVIMKATSTNLMNSLMKSILSLYSYDEKPDDISIPNVLRQSLQLIAKMPLLFSICLSVIQTFLSLMEHL